MSAATGQAGTQPRDCISPARGSYYRRMGRRHLTCAAGLVVALLAGISTARADSSRLSVGGELGVGSMLPKFQRDELNLGVAIQGSLRAGFTIADPLVLQLGLRDWWFPSSDGYARATTIALGLRLEP